VTCSRVSRSWYYEQSDQADPDPQDIALRDEIERIILEFSGYGYRRVTRELARRGWQVNHKRVLRVMQEESLLCHLKKRFVITTTNSRHGFPVYPNVLADMTLTAPNQAWVADFTSIRLRSAFVYLACILDAFSRRCVGWHLSREMNTQMTSCALLPYDYRATSTARIDPSFGSWRAVCKSRIYRATSGDWSTGQYVCGRKPV
jgi:hypothetical protein